MSPQTVGIIGFLIMVALIFLRMPVAIALGVVGTVGYAMLNGWTQSLLVLSRVPLTFASAYDLSVVPLFVLMGAIAAHSGMARELFQSINVMFSGHRGTLATATIGACAALGAVSGSSVAMVATMSHVAVPEMRRAGYDERLALGSVVAGGTLGILIPPSVMLIFYGLSAVQSIPKLFAAGMIPGLLLAALQIG
ncbi:MAG: TRAP transporter large permease subunit, partial [Pseudolabrys sp.]